VKALIIGIPAYIAFKKSGMPSRLPSQCSRMLELERKRHSALKLQWLTQLQNWTQFHVMLHQENAEINILDLCSLRSDRLVCPVCWHNMLHNTYCRTQAQPRLWHSTRRCALAASLWKAMTSTLEACSQVQHDCLLVTSPA